MNTGIVIGGPADGQIITHEHTVLEGHKLIETAPFSKRPVGPGAFDEPVPIERVVYYFTSLTALPRPGADAATFGFWVLREMDVIGAMSALVDAYHKTAEMRPHVLPQDHRRVRDDRKRTG